MHEGHTGLWDGEKHARAMHHVDLNGPSAVKLTTELALVRKELADDVLLESSPQSPSPIVNISGG